MPEIQPLTNVRFDLVHHLRKPDEDTQGFAYADLHQVPSVGDLINLDGHGGPYLVIELAWSIPDLKRYPFLAEQCYRQFAYLRILPAELPMRWMS